MTVQQRLLHVQQQMNDARLRADRTDSITIVAVTKYVDEQIAKEAVEAGLTHLGENRWQVAKDKWIYLDQLVTNGELAPIEWHFIGSMQTNKVKEVVGRFQYVHSLDRLALAEALHKQAEKLDTTIKCFIQVNVSGELSKSGMEPDAVYSFIDKIKLYPRVIPIGLMTMAPFEDNAEHTRDVFRQLRLLRDDIQHHSNGHSTIKELSMGMSNDFQIAIEEGATYVRLGSSLVGK